MYHSDSNYHNSDHFNAIKQEKSNQKEWNLILDK
jgi:hypothetical protein